MASEKTENGVQGFPYLKPPDKTFYEKLSTALYDKSENTILGRTPKNWGQLLLFYTIFFSCLAALFAICMQGLFASLDDRTPTWVLHRSLIGTNPGMGFRPISNNTDEGSLIWYNSKNATTIGKWVNLLNEFLHEYKIDNRHNRAVCDFEHPPPADKACEVNMEDFGDCSPDNDFGYNTSFPCVYLKLNRIYGWVPEYYNDTKNLPPDMPDDLVANIKAEYAKGPEYANQIWISCNGEHSVDKEHINSTRFEYYPTRGFPGYYYPYTNVNGYLSPLIAVQLRGFTPNIIISIECRAWAKNINYRGGYRDREGSVHFEIMRDI
ncbi:Sodium / potassium ATPase beta chain [Popillia japonica]|uniref:Sodium / potassium ATPase beta chain n=1 Tax=Popillia japonica TaxID=7064 RepID=A0AAW1N377_POPJA